MAIQSTPPLPDPTTGRIPSYTQVLQQDENTGQWVVMYDVSDASTTTTGTTGTITQLPGLTTPITQFPDLEDTTPSVPWQDTPIYTQDPTYSGVGGGAAAQRGGGRNNDPEQAGYVTGFDGNFYSAETGEQVSDRMQNFLTALQNSSAIMAIGSRANNTNAISQMSMESQRAMFSSEASQEAWGEMSAEDRDAFRENLALNARRNGVPASQVTIGNRRSSGLGGTEGPPGTPDPITGRMDRRAPPGVQSRVDASRNDSNYRSVNVNESRPSTPPGAVARGSQAGRSSPAPGPGAHSGRGATPPGAAARGSQGQRGGQGSQGGSDGAPGRGGSAGPGGGGHHGG